MTRLRARLTLIDGAAMTDLERVAQAIRCAVPMSEAAALVAAVLAIEAMRRPTSVEVREALLRERYGLDGSRSRPDRANR